MPVTGITFPPGVSEKERQNYLFINRVVLPQITEQAAYGIETDDESVQSEFVFPSLAEWQSWGGEESAYHGYIATWLEMNPTATVLAAGKSYTIDDVRNVRDAQSQANVDELRELVKAWREEGWRPAHELLAEEDPIEVERTAYAEQFAYEHPAAWSQLVEEYDEQFGREYAEYAEQAERDKALRTEQREVAQLCKQMQVEEDEERAAFEFKAKMVCYELLRPHSPTSRHEELRALRHEPVVHKGYELYAMEMYRRYGDRTRIRQKMYDEGLLPCSRRPDHLPEGDRAWTVEIDEAVGAAIEALANAPLLRD